MLNKKIQDKGKIIIRNEDVKFSELADNIPGVIYLAKNDLRFSIIYINKYIEKLTGYSSDLFLKKKMYLVDLFHPDDIEQIMEKLNEAINKKGSFNIIYRVRTKKGKYILVEDRGVCMFENDKLIYIQGFWHELSEKRKIEKALSVSEARYKNLVENEPVSVTRLRLKDKNYETVNKEFTRQSGYTLDEFNSLSDLELIEMIYSDDRYRIFDFFSTWQKEGYQGLKKIEYRIINKNKQIVWLETYLYSEFNEKGTIEFLNQICIDITERKKTEEALQTSEHRYKTFIEQTSDGIFRIEFEKPFPVGQDFNKFVSHFYKFAYIAECNKSFAKMYGYEQESDIEGKKILEMHGSDDVPENIGMLKDLYNHNFRAEQVMSKEIDKDNNTKYFLNNSFGVIKNNLLFTFWGSRIDITNTIKVEEQLKYAKEKAEELSRAKSSFLANVSHEIRTPMNGISGMIQLLEMTDLVKEQKDYIKLLRYSSDILTNLLNNILDFSKIESGFEKLDLQTFQLGIFLSRIFNIYMVEAENKNLEYILDFKNDLNFNVVGDSQKIEQILSNLISNAIKFTKSGHVIVSVEGKFISGTKLTLLITVSDTGIGIPEDKFDILFESFKQLDDSINKPYKGTGLGLSIVKKLTELIRGKITLESKKGTGSRFIFEIPLEIENTSLDNRYKDKGKRNILVVEDDIINQKLFRSLLLDKGFDIDVIDDGDKAFELYCENKYDLIIMDVHLFGSNGITATELIRKNEEKSGKRIPIIGFSAYTNENEIAECMKSGMDEYVPKPFGRAFFYEIINKYLK